MYTYESVLEILIHRCSGRPSCGTNILPMPLGVLIDPELLSNQEACLLHSRPMQAYPEIYTKSRSLRRSFRINIQSRRI